MSLNIIRNNIADVFADAIVNTANPKIAVGAGVDSVIYAAAGAEELIREREMIGEIEPGEAAFTPAFRLHAKYIIHTVGPEWQGGSFGEREIVASCYRKSLEMADRLGCKSIAFPLIATGTYGFPKGEALRIAIGEISAFLLSHDMEVTLVVYDKESFELSGDIAGRIISFIEERDVSYCAAPQMMGNIPGYYDNRRDRKRRLWRRKRDKQRQESFSQSFLDEEEALEDADLEQTQELYTKEELTEASASFSEEEDFVPPSIDDLLKHRGKTFQERLLQIIDRKGLKDPDVYKKANIDRKHFSKIRSKIDYTPTKKTALALAIALELNLDETVDLLMSAGLAFSPASKFDLIIRYCIENKIYDIHEINCVLFKYDQILLGA